MYTRKYSLTINNNEIFSFVTTWIDLEGTKSNREAQVLHDLSYMWNLNFKMFIDIQNRLVIVGGRM